ncbi:hypothetical protein CP556_12165 [Natrinema sp. CBA1119]|nr:hypothetical protein CP556_12165 [Natrinema sp. CBA1119]
MPRDRLGSFDYGSDSTRRDRCIRWSPVECVPFVETAHHSGPDRNRWWHGIRIPARRTIARAVGEFGCLTRVCRVAASCQ